MVTRAERSYEVRWGEPRKIRGVAVTFSEPAPQPEGVRLEYWHSGWDGRGDPVLAEAGAGGQGWAFMDDWTNGKWRALDARIVVSGNAWRFEFAPTGAREFKDLQVGAVPYRKTLKIRLTAEKSLPTFSRLQALTDSVCQPLRVRIAWGAPAKGGIQIGDHDSGHLEVFNGEVTAIRSIAEEKTRIDGLTWTTQQEGGIEADLVTAVDPVDRRYDRTIITLRSKQRPFSFAAEEVARGDRILVDDLGVLVSRADDDTSLEQYRAERKQWAGPTVYGRVFEEPEQTLSRAWKDMPLRRPMEFVHGLPGNRNVMMQFPDGNVLVSGWRHWFDNPVSPKDSERKNWPAQMLQVRFGLPTDDLRGGRELREGYLPVLRSWWQDGPIHYEQTSVLDSLDGKLEDVQLDDPTVLLVKIRMTNTSADQAAPAHLALASAPKPMPYTPDPDPGDEPIILKNGRVYATSQGKQLLRFLVRVESPGTLAADDKLLRWSRGLAPGQSQKIFFAIPSVTLSDESEIEALSGRDFESSIQRICQFWTSVTAGGTSIETPEAWLNDFYRAHLRHMLINCQRDPGSDRLFPHVGTFRYGVYANESVMMVSDFDRRGRHDLAARCLESWLHYQGTVGLPGNFQGKDGILYGANGHESGGYNKHHGYVMWGMAEHWRFTRDREWMERAAPGLIKACEWVIRERQAAKTAGSDRTRPIEFGFLPAGGLEDVQDYWYWMATNAATVWGFDAAADALADYGHRDAPRLVAEAKAYHQDVVAGLTEARVRSPVVRLRDGTYVPKFPSHLHERGRSYGWIRETLEGSMFLPVMGLVSPSSLESTWIMKDYEDNLYISDQYGYSIPVFDQFWFSRGGFSMQANLLDGPIPYLKRDEIKHFLRAYFNGFASAFDPAVRMCNEHSLPELGYPSGDHFKTSDEAQSASWLRLMFVHEQGEDLYLGQAIPRYWLADGKSASIERAGSHFGPLSLKLSSRVGQGEIQADLDPPQRNRPQHIYLRFRHPEHKPMNSVIVNGMPHDQFVPTEEWVILPGSIEGKQTVVVRY